jgi:hypothetical protein
MRTRLVPHFIGILSGLLIGGVLWLILSQPRGTAITLLPPPSPAPLRIHVAGAVRHPGVYSFPAGSLVEQAIEAAGAAAGGASLDASTWPSASAMATMSACLSWRQPIPSLLHPRPHPPP